VSGKEVDPLIPIVVDILEAEGYDAVQLREVARRARMSLATIYRRYPTRDALIVAALRWWMDANRYATIGTHIGTEESVYDGLMRIYRAIFEPWERHPQMLRAYVRSQAGPGGDELTRHGFEVVVPAADAVLAGCDAAFATDLGAVMSSVIYGSLARFGTGALDISEVVPTIERAVFWLCRGHQAVAG